jgi:hypothetical protein
MKKSGGGLKFPIWIVLLIAILALPTILIFHHYFSTTFYSIPRAAIIDQLGMQYPNSALIEKLTKQLEQYGFEVTIFGGKDVNVNLYKRLPEYGFHVIIFRTHSDITEENHETGKTLLFTNEPYSKFKYLQHQLNDRIVPANTPDNEDINFAVSSDYISKICSGNFDQSLIIMMGCASLRIPDMAQAFVDKGALVYIGWHAYVTLNYVDDTTPVLLDNLLTSGLSIKESLAKTIKEKEVDPRYGTFPLYYPYESGDCILSNKSTGK